jgi:tight adherence protein B
MLLTEVATRLRSGAAVDRAWRESLRHHGLDQVGGLRGHSRKEVLDDEGVPYALREIWTMPKWKRFVRGWSATSISAVPAAAAVCRMGYLTGAPMADILDACALGITESAEAQSARDVALAGPQSSATMLAALPGVGIAFGMLLGADPIHFLLHTRLGIAVFIAGIACEVAGIVLVRRLVARARFEEVDM